MKKIIVILLALLLCGCSAGKPDKQYETEMISVSKEALAKIENALSAKSDDFSCGVTKGVRVLGLDGTEPQLTDASLYQIYLDSELAYLAIGDESYVIIEVTKQIKDAMKKAVSAVEYKGHYALVNEDGVILLDEDQQEDEEMKKKIRELSGKIKHVDLSSAKVTDIIIHNRSVGDTEVVKINGIRYAANRIVIKFADGDRKKMSEQYAAFCNGTLVSSMKTVNVNVFTFNNLTAEELLDLQKRSEELDYVISASLDRVNYTN